MDTFLEFVVFVLEDQRYALPLTSVEKVIRSVEIIPLPKAPDIVSGMINAEGRLLPVFNLRKRFRLPEKEIGPEDHMIVARASSRTVSFWADQVEGVIEWPAGRIVPPGGIHPEVGYVEGVIKLENGIVFIHNLDRFLSLEEKTELDTALRDARRK